tara:strand:- start:34 stop:930 length:897 start_codon:yes stop_codon:yes gene_type:complete
MPTQRSISEIRSNLLRPALSSVFEVQIGLPRSALGTRLRGMLQGDKQTQLNLMCSDAVLPGSSLATTEATNDFTGVTERHAYRRIYDETIDLTFYVDAKNYLPIRFFEEWISGIVNENQRDALNKNYFYRVKYPDDYVAPGLKVIKFEKDYHDQYNEVDYTEGAPQKYLARKGSGSSLEYEFVRSYPRSITSMPVTYDTSSLLKCSVQMTYVRYVVSAGYSGGGGILSFYNPFQQAQFNSGGLMDTAAELAGAVVSRASRSEQLGGLAGDLISGRASVRSTARNVAGGLLGSAVRNLF